MINKEDKVSYSRVQKSMENFVFRPKMAIFRRAGIREGGRVATPTSFSIFDSYDMKSLRFKFVHDIFTGFKIASL